MKHQQMMITTTEERNRVRREFLSHLSYTLTSYNFEEVKKSLEAMSQLKLTLDICDLPDDGWHVDDEVFPAQFLQR